MFRVQDRTQPLIPLNAEHSKRLLIAIPNQNCLTHLVDGFVKSPLGPLIVIPAKAGILSFQAIMDSCLRRNDSIFDFLRIRQN